MSYSAHMNGARLAYVVKELLGNVKREVHRIGKKGEGIKVELKDQPAGFMVYFPRGHAIRIPSKVLLKHYGLDKAAKVINVTDVLSDPNSPLSKIIMAQDNDARSSAMMDMERMVIQMATAKTGPIVMAEQAKEIA